MHEIKNETQQLQIKSPASKNAKFRWEISDSTGNRADEEVVNIWLSSWETNSANICYVLQAVVIIIFKDMYCCLSVDALKPSKK